MDERFFLYFEDIDWCNRMKRHGWSVYYAPSSVMMHTYERSSARSVLRKPFLIHMLSLMRYYEKWNRFFYAVRRNRGAIKASVLAVSDLAALNLSFLAAYYLQESPPAAVHQLPLSGRDGTVSSSSSTISSSSSRSSRAGSTAFAGKRPSPRNSCASCARCSLGLVVLMAATYISRVRIYSRAVVIGQAGIAVFAVAFFRRAIREIHRELVKARFDLKRVVIVGYGGGGGRARRAPRRSARARDRGRRVRAGRGRARSARRKNCAISSSDSRYRRSSSANRARTTARCCRFSRIRGAASSRYG